MEHIWQWGIGVIIAVQKIRSPFFDAFFLFISFFGTYIFYMLLIPFIYWCYDKKRASRIIFLFLVSSWFNTVLKDLISHPRPYNLNPAVKIGDAAGNGFPSGHSQNSLVVWGTLSLMLKDKFRNDLRIKNIKSPLLIIHGEEDSVIPVNDAKNLFALANEPKEIKLIKGAGHNDLAYFGLFDVINSWLDKNISS